MVDLGAEYQVYTDELKISKNLYYNEYETWKVEMLR